MDSEGALRRWSGASINSQYSGCLPTPGNPIISSDGALLEVDLQEGNTTSKSFPEGEWTFVPRQPKVVAQVTRSSEGGGSTSVSFYDVWVGSNIASVTLDVNTEALQFDVTDTWVAPDGSEGAVVFSPTDNTPEESEEYVVAFFTGSQVTYTLRVKPKVDVDIYIRPDTDDGVLCYLRGNGISFPPSTEEVFTNASYLVYQSDGSVDQLALPIRGPGSGRGRHVIWHSNKWDRLLLTDGFASGALLVKASNGIVVDSITSVSIDPGDVKILSASGNNNDRWMTTHTKVGNKNALILWAMPETVEVSSILFNEGDNAVKQMPLAPWFIIVPFISSSGNSHTLFSWDPQDVVSVQEDDLFDRLSMYPNPATTTVSIDMSNGEGALEYVIVDVNGSVAQRGTTADGTIDISPLPTGSYTVVDVRGGKRERLQIVR